MGYLKKVNIFLALNENLEGHKKEFNSKKKEKFLFFFNSGTYLL